MDVYAISNCKAFTVRGENQSTERRCQGTSQARAVQSVPDRSHAAQRSEPPANTHLTVFRDQLYKHLETVPAGDFDGYTNKLVQAGSTLEFLKYADALFEILLVGGLLQPGGSYIDDGAPPSPFSIFNAQEPVEVADIKKYVDVLNKLIRRCVRASCIVLVSCVLSCRCRYKYLQKPLESSSLPSLLQYINRWSDAEREKFAVATGVMLAQGLASGTALVSLTKDHLVKNGAAHTWSLVCCG